METYAIYRTADGHLARSVVCLPSELGAQLRAGEAALLTERDQPLAGKRVDQTGQEPCLVTDEGWRPPPPLHIQFTL